MKSCKHKKYLIIAGIFILLICIALGFIFLWGNTLKPIFYDVPINPDIYRV